ncbi:polyprenyl synthetase family protein [Paenibacillus antri]|uniref:Polyprenyl synthetase family protein n=1 Tax=Paenibacillus antri TaxID=2582848 RepID=A0A5R9GF07_9BACL|nr:polyprenyl synthetase family protein [Paenibacillus antri]TLS51948.1 polyprenyl synthetase family protein [Paenibacillus antri]
MKLHEALGIDLAAVDAAMVRVVTEDADLPKDSPIANGVLELVRSGGKRLRPMLVLTGGRFGPAVNAPDAADKLLRLAVLMEYLHTASLVHDDIIDEAETRRGVMTLHRKTDVMTAVHTANYMTARAIEWAGDGGVDAAHSAELTSLAAQLCIGEYGQLRNRFNFDVTMDAYLEKTRNKTALLIASCLQAGAAAAGATPEVAKTLYAFGDALGMSFQIQDDILDFSASAEALGKPAGADLRSGNVTLPTLFALDVPGLGDAIRGLREDAPESAFQDVVRRIAESEAMERAAALRDEYADRARRLADRLRRFPAHDSLLAILRHFTDRRS